MSSFAVGYGSSYLDISVPDHWRVSELRSSEMPGLDDPASAIRQALNGPISAPPLSNVLKGAGNVVIVVSDGTRVTRADVFLPILLDAANEAGISDGDITVLFSTGTHTQQTDKQRKALAGPLAAGRVRLVDHDPGADDLVDLGATPAGTPVLVSRIAHEADRLIVTGVIQLHYFAGFGGGRKGVLPGISGEESIVANHSFTVSPDGGRNSDCRTAKLDGNPLHEDMMEAA